MTSRELDEDLVVRARRDALTPTERVAFEQAVQARPELRSAYQAGLAVDRVVAVQGGDEALIGRMADAALARAAQVARTVASGTAPAATAEAVAVRGRERDADARSAASAPGRIAIARWAMAAALALSVLGASTLATALVTGAALWEPIAWLAARVSGEPAPQVEARAARGRPRTSRPVPAASPRPASDSPVAVAGGVSALATSEDVAAAEPASPEPPAERARAEARSGSAPTPADHAAELFRDANAARRDADAGRARRLYARLIAAHPASDEASLARVSLGRLLLAAGEARAAEREFRRYLAAGGGQLAEEARVGQAQSLGRLRRSAGERDAWQRLLDAYPTSVYAAEARRRLSELDADAIQQESQQSR